MIPSRRSDISSNIVDETAREPSPTTPPPVACSSVNMTSGTRQIDQKPLPSCCCSSPLNPNRCEAEFFFFAGEKANDCEVASRCDEELFPPDPL